MKDFETDYAHWAMSWDAIDPESSPLGSASFSKDKGARLFTPGQRLLHLSFNGVEVVADPPTDLFGIANDKKYYVLLNGIPGKTDPAGQEVISDTLLIGANRFDYNAPVSEIEFELKGLENWAKGFGVPSLRDLSKSIEEKPTHELELYSDDEKSIVLKSGYIVSPKPSGSAQFDRICEIVIHFQDHVSFNQALDDAYSILLLVSFCTGWYASFTKICITNALDESYCVLGRFKDDESHSFNVYESPISFEEFLGRSADLIAAWIGCSEHLKTAIYEYVPLATERQLIYGDLRIIAVSQVFEALGRASNAVAEVNPEQEQKKKRLKAEAKQLPESELRKWALKKLKEKKRVTYKDGVRKVLSDIGPFVDVVIPDKEKFIDLQVELRNDFVHRNPIISSHENEYLLYHTHVAMMLCQASIMRFIGFSESEIFDALDGYKRDIRRRFASFYSVADGG